jgi:hypothetical protein
LRARRTAPEGELRIIRESMRGLEMQQQAFGHVGCQLQQGMRRPHQARQALRIQGQGQQVYLDGMGMDVQHAILQTWKPQLDAPEGAVSSFPDKTRRRGGVTPYGVARAAPSAHTPLRSLRNTGTPRVVAASRQQSQTQPLHTRPPAVANAYINSSTWRTYLTGKQRGCVISKIAEQHGKNAAYGPKGGPYEAHAIQQAVGSFAGSCPA